MVTYRKGKYSVQIANDGKIIVKKGDWLSKYSYARHGDFKHIFEYGRKNRDGLIKRVANVNRIITGEVLYHIPTVAKQEKDSEKKPTYHKWEDNEVGVFIDPKLNSKMIKDLLGNDFEFSGENFDLLLKVSNYLSNADTALSISTSIIEVVPLIGRTGIVSASGSVVGGAGTAVGVIGNVSFPIIQMINVWNLNEVGLRAIGMRAVAYATTAWAFNQTPPISSKVEVINSITFTDEKKKSQVVWTDILKRTKIVLENEVIRRNVEKKVVQAVYQAVGSGIDYKLCEIILKSYEKKLSRVTLDAWKSNYKHKYPN